jgi:DNA primase
MLDVMRWADEQYQKLLEAPVAEPARRYLDERRLSGETIHRFGLGFSPPEWQWLVQRAAAANISTDVLEKVGLIAKSDKGRGYYDRFRDRVMFPIRNTRGQTVGFGGRILPSSAAKGDAPKYYNSADTPLFTKSEQLYGLHEARQAGAAAGYLAVVEGYTDVLMAHQMGISNVVATLGTALNGRHVQHLRRFVSRVVLVFDGDAAGQKAVDNALKIFISHEMELAIATLPEGLDPCDLLVQQGPEPLRKALDGAINALDFKLNQLVASGLLETVDGRREAIDSLLGVIVKVPWQTDQKGQIKRELVINRIAQRLALTEKMLWDRLGELRQGERKAPSPERSTLDASRSTAPAPPHEKELLEVLLAEPTLVPMAAEALRLDEIGHPGVRRLVEVMFAMQAEGETPDIERLRERIEHPQLVAYAFRARDIGRQDPDRPRWLAQIVAEFERRRREPRKAELNNQLHAVADHVQALALLRQLQEQGDSNI